MDRDLPTVVIEASDSEMDTERNKETSGDQVVEEEAAAAIYAHVEQRD